MPEVEEKTAEEIAQDYTAMGHSVDLLTQVNQRIWKMTSGQLVELEM